MVMNGNVWKSGNGFQIKKGGIKPPKNRKNRFSESSGKKTAKETAPIP